MIITYIVIIMIMVMMKIAGGSSQILPVGRLCPVPPGGWSYDDMWWWNMMMYDDDDDDGNMMKYDDGHMMIMNYNSQAACFHLPRLIWKHSEGGLMKMLVGNLTDPMMIINVTFIYKINIFHHHLHYLHHQQPCSRKGTDRTGSSSSRSTSRWFCQRWRWLWFV